jgi:hypothetical protein
VVMLRGKTVLVLCMLCVTNNRVTEKGSVQCGHAERKNSVGSLHAVCN